MSVNGFIDDVAPAARKVLVIDDEPRILSSIEDLLNEDFFILTATEARTGLHLLEEECQNVAVILCDQRMPGMSGDEFLTRAKEISLATRVLITGYSDMQALVRAVNHGQIYGYVAKPWDPAQLKFLVTKAAHHFELVNALRESEERFRKIFESAPMGMAVLGPGRRFIKANPAVCRMLGYEEEDLMGMTLDEFTHSEDRGRVDSRTDRVGEREGRRYETEKRYLRKDRQVVWAHLSVATLGERHGYQVAMLEDITARKEAEQARERLVQILEATPDFVSIFDLAGRCIYLNRAGREILGVSSGEGARLPFIVEAHPDRQRRLILEEAVPAATRDGIWSGETYLVRRDGTEIPVLQVLVAHRNADQQVEFLSTIARDVGRLKSLEEQARQSQKLEAIGTLAGGVAHDFNNLLTAIIGYSQLLLAEVSDNSAMRSDLLEIQKAAERAGALTRQLLAFSRRQVLQPRVIDLNSVIGDLNKMLHRLIGEDIQVVTRSAEDLWRVKADPGQIEQVLLNLVVNARDAMPGGGRLTIETANLEIGGGGGGKYGDLAPGRYAVLSVTDTGTGIPDEIRSRIFEPFFTTKEKGRGTGLGLSTVYGIVTQSRGGILIQSELNRGTTFKIFLPRSEGEPESWRQERAASPARGSETILVVEDDDLVRGLARRALSAQGYRVLEASDGARALELASGHDDPIHLVLTDVVMPNLGGRELTQRLLELHPESKILFISGYRDRTLGAEDDVDFLAKPFSPEALIAKVREVLDRR